MKNAFFEHTLAIKNTRMVRLQLTQFSVLSYLLGIILDEKF